MKKYHLDTCLLSSLTRSKRFTKGLRDAAQDAGLSTSTLSRVENGKLPDMETFLTLCSWLDVRLEDLIKETVPAAPSETLVEAAAQSKALSIRSDQFLDPVAANVLAEIITAAYSLFPRKLEDE